MSILKYPEVKWSIPVLFANNEYVMAISSVMKRLNLPNPITYAYGMVPSLWTGGRISSFLTQDKNIITKILRMVISAGSIPTFTFSKYDITKEELGDEFCNWLLDFGVENECNFIMTSDLLYDYIKNKHPEAKCVASVLKPIYELNNQELSETDFYNNLLDKYERVVVRPEYAKDTLLKEYKNLKDLSKIEVLVNQICVPNCKVAIKEHLSIPHSDWEAFCDKMPYREDKNIKCPNQFIRENKKKYKIYLSNPTLMFTEPEIDNLVNNIGIKNLKLQGRNYIDNYIIRIVHNYIFENIGEYQNICPLIWGTRENLISKGVFRYNEYNFNN